MSPRINDLLIENEFGFTRTEQFSAMVSIKLLILSELMLSFARLRGLINARFISNLCQVPYLYLDHSSLATFHVML